jgi:hypothetical protein
VWTYSSMAWTSVGVPPTAAGVMLRTYGTVLLGMKPQRNRSTDPSAVYLLGLRITTRSGWAMAPLRDMG